MTGGLIKSKVRAKFNRMTVMADGPRLNKKAAARLAWEHWNERTRKNIPERPTRLKRTMESPKRMLPVFSSPLGVLLVDVLPNGQHFDGL
jgi:hypothetical protein